MIRSAFNNIRPISTGNTENIVYAGNRALSLIDNINGWKTASALAMVE